LQFAFTKLQGDKTVFKVSGNTNTTFKRSISAALPLAALAVGLFSFLPSRGAAADNLEKLKGEVRTFHNRASDLYRLDDQDMNQIWERYCGELDPRDNEDKKAAAELGKRLQEEEIGIRRRLMDEYTKLKKLALEVEAEVTSSGDKAEAKKLKDAADSDNTKLQNLDNGIVLKGAGHPFVQFAIDYGIKRHQDMCKEHGKEETRVCDTKFKNVPNGRERPDLVVVEDQQLKVYEFKPDTTRAKNAGAKALEESYVPAVKSYYEKFFPNGREGGIDRSKGEDEEFKTKEITEALAKSPKAWNGKELAVQREVKTYQVCEKPIWELRN
jgi:hypothetical protein